MIWVKLEPGNVQSVYTVFNIVFTIKGRVCKFSEEQRHLDFTVLSELIEAEAVAEDINTTIRQT